MSYEVTADDPQFLRHIMRQRGFSARPHLNGNGSWVIGYGRDLRMNPLAEAEGRWLLERDLFKCENAMVADWPKAEGLDAVRYYACLNVVHGSGIEYFMSLRDVRDALEEGDWEQAAIEMLRAVPPGRERGEVIELASMLRTGEWPTEDRK